MNSTTSPIFPAWIKSEDPNVAILEDHLLQISRPSENEQANAMWRGSNNRRNSFHPYPPSARASASASAGTSTSASASAGTSTSASASASASISTSASEEKSWALVRSGKGSGFPVEQVSKVVKSTTFIDIAMDNPRGREIHISFKDATREICKIQVCVKITFIIIVQKNWQNCHS
eukprot:GHVP01022426.1.p1 GENE.GHVP01022426.1~~GHVP01022426.1.p1  ORF type:complete len:176 (+),score=13.03 GHVP01022426.1:69-596(+)